MTLYQTMRRHAASAIRNGEGFVCPWCGTKVRAGIAYCPKCGTTPTGDGRGPRSDRSGSVVLQNIFMYPISFIWSMLISAILPAHSWHWILFIPELLFLWIGLHYFFSEMKRFRYMQMGIIKPFYFIGIPIFIVVVNAIGVITMLPFWGHRMF